MSKLIKNEFLKKGYFIINLDKKAFIEVKKIKTRVIKIIKKEIKFNKKVQDDLFINSLHKFIYNEKLNNLRLKVFNEINKNNFNKIYYNIFSYLTDKIVGNELAIQKKVNLSIQLPKDESSLLPIHSDTWAGDSPYEVVVWLPLVNCYKSKSMFILPYNEKFIKKFNKFRFRDNEDIYKRVKKKVKFLNIKFGQVLIFTQNLPHGNIVNKEKTSRISFNFRVKSLFSPYSKKTLLDFFDPINVKPATKIGIKYEYPNFK